MLRDLDAGDVEALAAELRATIEGEVRFDDAARALYATDASNYRQVPLGVVVPRSIDDVLKTVRLCHRHGAPLLSRGGGTSLCGQCCNVAVVLDFSKYLNRVIAIDKTARTARVQPGTVLDDLRAAARPHGLTFAPDPATHTHNTLGGMIGNNSCGPHSVLGGETVRNVIALDVLTYDGTRMTVGADAGLIASSREDTGDRGAGIIARLRELALRYADEIRRCFPQIPRRVSGYNLPALLPENGFNLAQALVGSEGTCVVVLEATLRLLDDPACRTLVVLGYPDVYAAGDHIPQVMAFKPIAVEGIDKRLVRDIRAIKLHPKMLERLPPGAGWLLVEFGAATREAARRQAQDMIDALQGAVDAPSIALFEDPGEQAELWTVRESGLGATAHVPNHDITWEGWEDSAVPPERLGEYLRKLRALFDKYEYGSDLYGHFGQGCVHTRVNFDLTTAPGIEKYRRFAHEAARLVVDLGGSISGEHGDGQSKAELLELMFGQKMMQAFREFKSIWDPEWKLNPGKVVGAHRMDENLRLGTRYDPPQVASAFHYTEDNGDFSRALLRCVGVGECRKSHGIMCPSYMATREELHSTRGRAHLLFEMLRGEVIKDGWQSRAVHEALDLCLSCKGCKGECPVRVDMATYKAEFMSRYYALRRRPLNVFAFGIIDSLALLGSHMPGVANFLTGREPFATFTRRLLHMAPQRRIPPLARQSFAAWFRERAAQARTQSSSGSGRAAGSEVVLWPDTFSNYFDPPVARAAVTALEQAGFDVRIPAVHLCCGRPLYEAGMLPRARRYLEKVMHVLADDIHAGTPIVGLEPACVSVFREELPNLFPHDEQARRFCKQVFLLSEFMQMHADAFRVPPLRKRAIVHGHCHHHSVLNMEAEKAVLAELGLEFEVLDSGCCGMAGSFGFDKNKYGVSMACAERVLLPAVRTVGEDALVMADGFSCREQIRQGAGRNPLHLSQVVELAMRRNGEFNGGGP